MFCDHPHKLSECYIDSKKSLIRQKKLFFICPRSGHIAEKCSSKIKSVKYLKRHHEALCEGNQNDKNNSINYTTNDTISSASILLQTPRVKIRSPISNQAYTARIIFDSGSQLSYITSSLH